MATLTGFLVPPPSGQEDLDWLQITISFDRYADDVYPLHDLDGSLGAGSGSLTDGSRTMPAAPHPGWSAGSFGDLDWYNRIHVVPPRIDLGNMIGSQIRSAEVFNAYFSSKLLTAIVPTGAAGIVLTPPDPAPTTYGALESRIHSVQVSLSGPAQIDASYAFSFPSESPKLRITGQRVVAFAVSGPDWSQPLVERLIWLTDVIEARDGTEQRISLRKIPRREIDYHVVASGREARATEALLWGWQGRIYALPMWQDIQRLTAAVSVGATSITVDTTDREYAVGSLVILMAADGTNEVIEISGVSSGSLSLATPAQQSWLVGTPIMPARLARLASAIDTTRHSADVLEADFKWRIEPLEPVMGTAAASPTQYRGNDVLLRQPNWIGGLDQQLTRQLDEIDGDTGPRAIVDRPGRPTQIRSYSWLLKTRAEIRQQKDWLARRNGRQRPVWVPTWTTDMVLAVQASAVDTTLIIEDVGYRLWYALQAGRRDLAIRLPDGSRILRRITAADQVVAGQERITIDAAAGQILPVGTRASYIGLHRLDADQIEIAWHTAGVAVCATNLRLIAD